MKKVIAGIDIGGTNTAIGLVGKMEDGKLHIIDNKECRISTKKNLLFPDYINEIVSNINKLLGNEYELTGIGVGVPAANSATGTIDNAANLNWKGVLPIKQLLNEHFPNVNIEIINDANAVTRYEIEQGKFEGQDFVVITLGTGLGSGLAVRGVLIEGHEGRAGEVGHTTAVPFGRKCGCGRLGCLETYASATGIVKTTLELMHKKGANSILQKIEPPKELTSKDIYDAAIEGDSLAIEAFNITCEILGRSLADVVAYLNPKAIILHGGLAKAGDLILLNTKDSMNRHLIHNFYKSDIILEIGSDNAGIIGAAYLNRNTK